MAKRTVAISAFAIGSLALVSLFSACASFQAAGEVQRGRKTLLTGRVEPALAHFERAAEIDPNYIMDFSPFEQGVWTYVGKSYYLLGRLPEARKALARAVAQYDQDSMARLYLGLTLARQGDRRGGLKEIESGLKGVHDWLEWITYHTWWGQFWDPSRKIRKEIESDLAMISGRDIDWPRLIASGEWVGKTMEEEIDLARRDESKELRMDGDDKRR